MGYYDESPRKRLLMALFMTCYLLPMTLLFLFALHSLFHGWMVRILVTIGFGGPLIALWLVALRYPHFKKNVCPLDMRTGSAKVQVFLLLQGVIVTTLSVVTPLLMREIKGYAGFAEAVFYVIGIFCTPGALFATAVLLKMWKERSKWPLELIA